jgi:hypothetical protein
MIATLDDVLDGFRALWVAAGLPALVTGGLYDWRKVPAADLPFAVMMAKAGARRRTTAHSYLEWFTLTLWVHWADGLTDRRAIDRHIPRVDWGQGVWPATRGRCLHVRPLAGPTEPSPLKNLARDVGTTTAAWELLMQQDRPILTRAG